MCTLNIKIDVIFGLITALVFPTLALATPNFDAVIEDQYEVISTSGKRFERYLKLAPETLLEIDRIETDLNRKVPGFKLHVPVVPLDRSSLIDRQQVDRAEYEKLKAELKVIFAYHEKSFEDEKLILPAISKGQRTYFFPDFHQLSVKEQATQLLIEAYSRKHGGVAGTTMNRILSLEKQLKFAALVEQVLSAEKLDLFKTLKKMVSLGIISSEDCLPHIVRLLEDELKRPVYVSDLFEAFPSGMTSFDPSIVQEFQDEQGLVRNYAEMLEGTLFVTTPWVSNAAASEVCPSLRGHFGKWVVKPLKDNELALVNCEDQKSLSATRLWTVKSGPFLKKFEQ